jgi:hypothetical protein
MAWKRSTAADVFAKGTYFIKNDKDESDGYPVNDKFEMESFWYRRTLSTQR